MTKKNWKNILIIILFLAIAILVWQTILLKSNCEWAAVKDVGMAWFTTTEAFEDSETAEQWDSAQTIIERMAFMYEPHPKGKAAQRILAVCQKLQFLEFDSEDYEQVKMLVGQIHIAPNMSKYHSYFVIEDEDSFKELEELMEQVQREFVEKHPNPEPEL